VLTGTDGALTIGSLTLRRLVVGGRTLVGPSLSLFRLVREIGRGISSRVRLGTDGDEAKVESEREDEEKHQDSRQGKGRRPRRDEGRDSVSTGFWFKFGRRIGHGMWRVTMPSASRQSMHRT
jgi:hypothetical protein